MDNSKYRLYALGHAAERKVDCYNWELECTPTERVQYSDGALTNRGEAIETEGTDGGEKQYASKELVSGTVNAEWLCREANRLTCPNVEAGEELFIWTYEKTGKFFWETRNNGKVSRREETVCIGVAADPAGNEGTQRSQDNSYILDISAHKKIVTISTSDKNDELARFTLQLNGGEGFASLQDSEGQEVTLDPTSNRISVINAEDVELHLQGKNLTVNVPADEAHNVQGNFTITVNGAAYIKAETATIESTLNTIVGPTKIDGPLEVTGPSKLNGAASPLPITAPNIK